AQTDIPRKRNEHEKGGESYVDDIFTADKLLEMLYFLEILCISPVSSLDIACSKNEAKSSSSYVPDKFQISHD
ncbi:hypothetical protein WA026_012957, partial [Henosepilachna vigintioctopunctata]